VDHALRSMSSKFYALVDLIVCCDCFEQWNSGLLNSRWCYEQCHDTKSLSLLQLLSYCAFV
jgi:hypothetical protein